MCLNIGYLKIILTGLGIIALLSGLLSIILFLLPNPSIQIPGLYRILFTIGVTISISVCIYLLTINSRVIKRRFKILGLIGLFMIIGGGIMTLLSSFDINSISLILIGVGFSSLMGGFALSIRYPHSSPPSSGSNGRNNTRSTIGLIVSILAILVSTYAAHLASETSYNIVKIQEKAIQKQAAQALYFDVSNFQAFWGPWLDTHTKDLSVISTPTGEIYPSTGLYFVFNKEIAKFNLSLSRKLYDFYDNLLLAERQRKDSLVDYPLTINNDQRKRDDLDEMYNRLEFAYDESETLKKLLNQEINEANQAG